MVREDPLVSVAEREIHGTAAEHRVRRRRTEEHERSNPFCLTTADATACLQASHNNTQWRREAPRAKYVSADLSLDNVTNGYFHRRLSRIPTLSLTKDDTSKRPTSPGVAEFLNNRNTSSDFGGNYPIA